MEFPLTKIALLLRSKNILFIREYKFHPKRKWMADFAIPNKSVLIEYEGGTWSGGRHIRALGYKNDCEKYNAAQICGWRVLRYTSDIIKMVPRQVLDDLKSLDDCLHKDFK